MKIRHTDRRARLGPGTFAAAYLLDLALGDPGWAPHPVRAIGRAVTIADTIARGWTRTAGQEIAAGAVTALAIAFGAAGASLLAMRTAHRAHVRLGWVVEVYFAWTALATRSLLAEAGAVLGALDAGDLELARARVSRIVGRDTDRLDAEGVCRAVIETLAESLSDGIVAPIAYLAAGGVPAAIAYKAVNTLDSMIGHPEPPYTHFGLASARADDVANLLPARLSALLVVGLAPLAGGRAGGALRAWVRDGAKHPSPNAGQPEAAMAGALGVRLGGVSTYDGRPSEKPQLNPEGEPCSPEAVRRAMRVTAAASLVAGVAAVGLLWWRSRNGRDVR